MKLFLDVSVFALRPVDKVESAKSPYSVIATLVRGIVVRYTTRMETSFIDGVWVYHFAERTGMVIIAPLF